MNNRMNKYILCEPKVFEVPTCKQDPNLIAVMMPFDREFSCVSEAIKDAAKSLSLECKRADDIWEASTIVQDIFNLIFKSSIVICDFSTKNPNVLYETGIAHLMGRNVIIITQSIDDIPFDLKQYRVLKYRSSKEGLEELRIKLAERIKTLTTKTDDYISVPRKGADEMEITRRWYNPPAMDGTISPIMAKSTESIAFSSNERESDK